jgi:hypothetical protein
MSRIMRNTAILAKIETTEGTDALPTAIADALLISNASFELINSNVDRDVLRAYIGNSESLVGTRFVRATFDVELSGSGAAATAPAWGKLLIASAFAEVTGASMVEYTPVTNGLKTLTIKYLLDGLQHTMTGCMGTVSLDMTQGVIPKLKFVFTGIDAGRSAVALPALTLTAWKVPRVITAENSGAVTLGGTYAAGAITGGTAFASRGLSVDVGNDVKQIALVGQGNQVDITQRSVTGSVQMELTAAQEITMFSDINANTLTSLSFLHGSTAGAKVLVYAPAVQRINPKHVDFEGRAHFGMDLRFTPLAGNDELRIVSM